MMLSPTHTFYLCFFFRDPARTVIFTLSLHDALPILSYLDLRKVARKAGHILVPAMPVLMISMSWSEDARRKDRKITRLNSSHGYISYAVFCLKKKKIHVVEVITCLKSSVSDETVPAK